MLAPWLACCLEPTVDRGLPEVVASVRIQSSGGCGCYQAYRIAVIGDVNITFGEKISAAYLSSS